MVCSLLISGRDPGAAQGLVKVAEAALRDPRFRVSIFAAEPAYERYAAADLPVARWSTAAIDRADHPRIQDLLAEADWTLRRVRPDALLVGLSGPDAGIDEALLARAEPVTATYALQDFPGDVNLLLARPAGTYFVVDGEAARITKRCSPGRIEVVGSIKHAPYRRLNPGLLRAAGRRRLEAPDERLVVGFYSQPLWIRPGYDETIAGVAEALAQTHRSTLVVVRPHPKETEQESRVAVKEFRSAGLDCCLDPNEEIEQSLSASDIVTTVYSTCGADQLYLNKVSDRPMGTVLYLLFERRMREWHAVHTATKYLPGVSEGAAWVAEDARDLPRLLRFLATEEAKAAAWQAVRDRLPSAEDGVASVLGTIAGDYASRTGGDGSGRRGAALGRAESRSSRAMLFGGSTGR